ncbi:Blp family class II bacteriocin [Lactobacillus sp. ESL0681]|uniref:Blp family class II bacteriocin n=1 Tax=Lactobacillus sp. ESL0681 TaxID=2983211 RepID=UPI0023F8393A|nr:Blp family class II bacteriocin [Lactobacillus sp. ESL0681]WEV40249.1 Blp family class II bacteriocin [Lactobacillus sp. ESL0681]
MNKYQIIDEQSLLNIVGGNKWGDAVLGGLSGATAGLKACKGLGAWGMAICGVAGAGIGAYWEYNK